MPCDAHGTDRRRCRHHQQGDPDKNGASVLHAREHALHAPSYIRIKRT